MHGKSMVTKLVELRNVKIHSLFATVKLVEKWGTQGLEREKKKKDFL